MKRKKMYYLSVLITFITLPLIALTIDSYALTFFDNEEEFLFSAPVANTEPFDGNAEGILPFTFSGTIFDDDIADPRMWRIASQPYGFGIPTTSNVLFSTSVQDDYFSFGTNNYVNAFGFFLFRPYHDETIGGLINIDVIEIDGQISTYVHDQDGQWLFFGFISGVGISQVKVYNSTEDGILDTNFAYDNISRTEILQITEPKVSCVTTTGELQTALVQAADNSRDDIIHIVQGTYYGNFVYASTESFGVTIKGGYTVGCASRVLDPANTVLDAGGSGHVLVLSAPDVVAHFVVEGITIQNGQTTGSKGAGLYVNSKYNINVLTNQIINNHANGPNDGTGGGVYIYSEGDGNIIFDNNIIRNNTGYYHGGGAYISGGDEIVLSNNTISNNACQSFDGGGVYAIGKVIRLINNSISNNTTGRYGGGASIYSIDSSISLINNTITTNYAELSGGGCNIRLLYNQANAYVYNNIYWSNSSEEGADLSLYNDHNNDFIPSTVNLYNNDFDQSANGIYIQIPFPIDSSNLDNEDPLFYVNYIVGDEVEAVVSHHLQPGSPCIDAGTSQNAPADDIDGDPRPWGAEVDIGADEYISPEDYWTDDRRRNAVPPPMGIVVPMSESEQNKPEENELQENINPGFSHGSEPQSITD